MNAKIIHRPAYAMAEVSLAQGESVLAESGSMVAMSSGVGLTTEKLRSRADAGGGLAGKVLGAVKQMMGGESFLVNRVTGPGTVLLAPTHVGDIRAHRLDGDLVIQSGSFLGCDPGITLDGEWGGARSFFAGEGLFMLRASGTGTVLFNAFGGIEEVAVDGTYVVDTGHIVAFDQGLSYTVEKFGSGWIQSLTSGEGLVARFSGKGKLWLQTRNLNDFGRVVGRLLPPRER